MRDSLFNGRSTLNGIDDGSEHGEDDAAVHKEDAKRHRAAIEAWECRERGGQQMPAVYDGEPKQHEREAGHEQRRGNLAGKDDVNGATVVVAHDERADAQVDIAANNEHADPDGKLAADYQAQHAGKQQCTVADGVHNLAEPRDRFGHAGNLTVHPVGGGRDGIDDDGDNAVVIRHKQVQEDQREDQAREGNEIGDREDLIRRVIGSADKLLFDLLFDAHRTPPLVNDKTFDTIPVLAMSIQREHKESRHEDGIGRDFYRFCVHQPPNIPNMSFLEAGVQVFVAQTN